MGSPGEVLGPCIRKAWGGPRTLDFIGFPQTVLRFLMILGVLDGDIKRFDSIVELVILDKSHGLFLMESRMFGIGLNQCVYNFD